MVMGCAIRRDELGTTKKTMKFPARFPRVSRAFGSEYVFSRAFFVIPPDLHTMQDCKTVSFHILDLNFLSFLDV